MTSMARSPRLGTQLHKRAFGPSPASKRSIDVYEAGLRTGDSAPLDDVAAAMKAATEAADSVVVISYDRPQLDEIWNLSADLDLQPQLANDLTHEHQRSLCEQYNRTMLVVVKSALYIDEDEDVVFSEFQIIAQGNVVVILRRGGDEDVDWTTREFTQHADLLAIGAQGFVCAVIDRVVREYDLVLDGLTIDVEQIERQVFSGDSAAPERIYRLSREVVDFQHTASPLNDVLDKLRHEFEESSEDPILEKTLRGISGELAKIVERIGEIRDLLDRILTVNATLVGQRQNEDMKRISSWAAILVAPTTIAAIYDMNFDNMPELHWAWGYAASFGAMIVVGMGLYWIFKRRGWL